MLYLVKLTTDLTDVTTGVDYRHFTGHPVHIVDADSPDQVKEKIIKFYEAQDKEALELMPTTACITRLKFNYIHPIIT